MEANQNGNKKRGTGGHDCKKIKGGKKRTMVPYVVVLGSSPHSVRVVECVCVCLCVCVNM